MKKYPCENTTQNLEVIVKNLQVAIGQIHEWISGTDGKIFTLFGEVNKLKISDEEKSRLMQEFMRQPSLLQQPAVQPPPPSTPPTIVARKRGFPVNPYLADDIDTESVTELVRAYIYRCVGAQKSKCRISIDGHSFTLNECVACIHHWLIYNGKTYSEENNVAAYKRFLEQTCPDVIFGAIQTFNRIVKMLDLPCELSKVKMEQLARYEITEKELTHFKLLYADVQLFFQNS